MFRVTSDPDHHTPRTGRALASTCSAPTVKTGEPANHLTERRAEWLYN